MPVRAPSTTIDALEQEFQRKKKRELEQARMTGANGSSDGPAQRRAGEKVGRNDLCPCGSGKKYKKCHGVTLSPDRLREGYLERHYKIRVQGRLNLAQSSSSASPVEGLSSPGFSLSYSRCVL